MYVRLSLERTLQAMSHLILEIRSWTQILHQEQLSPAISPVLGMVTTDPPRFSSRQCKFTISAPPFALPASSLPRFSYLPQAGLKLAL